MPRYYSNSEAYNNDELYKDLFEKRGIPDGVLQYRTNLFGSNAIPNNISTIKHVWTMGVRFYKLSYTYYGTYDYWWVIALYNKKPTEAHMTYGDEIRIPVQPDVFL